MENALSFAKWLNKNRFSFSPFKKNCWISPDRRDKYTKSTTEYTTEQLLDEYNLLIKCNIIK